MQTCMNHIQVGAVFVREQQLEGNRAQLLQGSQHLNDAFAEGSVGQQYIKLILSD